MNGLREKFRNNKGFTLIEMLIVVAIIAILIAISIPLVGQALERARESTDAANERSFKAELVICYLSGTIDGSMNGTKFEVNTPYVYDAASGSIKAATETVAVYGKGTSAGTDTTGREKAVLYGYIDTNGVVHMGWTTATGGQTTNQIDGLYTNGGLTSEKLVNAGT